MATEVNLGETTLLLTRPETAAQRFRTQVEARLGHPSAVLISPLMRIVSLPLDWPPETQDGLLFSSENGVEALVAHQTAEGRNAWCVGARTADCALSSGFRIRAVCANAEELGALLIAERPTEMLVHVAGRHRRGALVERLQEAGISVRTLEAYDQKAQHLSDPALECLAGTGDIVVPLFSPRSAELFAKAAAARRAKVHVAAISAAAAQVWTPRTGERVATAGTPDAEGVLQAMGRLFDADPSA